MTRSTRLCPGLSAPAGQGRKLDLIGVTGQAFLSQYCPPFIQRKEQLRHRGMRPIQVRVAIARHACRLVYRMLTTPRRLRRTALPSGPHGEEQSLRHDGD